MKNRRPSLLLALATIINIGGTYSQKPQLGGSVSIYGRFGHLDENMRVLPIYDNTTWFFREKSVNVVKDPAALPKNQSVESVPRLFTGIIEMEFCDSVQQLLKSYFRDFQFEGIAQPWRALNANWSNAAIAERFGINTSYVADNYAYVILKYSRFRNSEKLASPDNVKPTDTITEEIERIEYGDVPGLVEFFTKFGSHYINSYTTGNALYQVFVYTHSYMDFLKEEIRTRGLFQISFYELSIYFSPWHAVQVGSVQSSSGNHTLNAWIADKLRGRHTEFAYTSLMKLHRNPLLLQLLDGVLQDEAVLRLELRSMAPFAEDSEKRAWFEEYIADYIKDSES